MPSFTDRLGLIKHTLADQFRIQDYVHNWDTLDRHPGQFVTTSGARPVWGSRHEGMIIYEKDTGLEWRWTGAAWERVRPLGLLGHNTHTADVVNATTAFVTAVDVGVVAVEGGKSLQISVSAPGWHHDPSPAQVTEVQILRDTTVIQEWTHEQLTGETTPRVLNMTVVDEAVTPGSYTYSLDFRPNPSLGGTMTLHAAANAPIGITVVEI